MSKKIIAFGVAVLAGYGLLSGVPMPETPLNSIEHIAQKHGPDAQISGSYFSPLACPPEGFGYTTDLGLYWIRTEYQVGNEKFKLCKSWNGYVTMPS